MQFDLGNRSLQTQEQAAIRGTRIVYAVAIAEETLSIAAEIQERIPVGTVASESGNVVGDNDANLAQGDTTNERR